MPKTARLAALLLATWGLAGCPSTSTEGSASPSPGGGVSGEPAATQEAGASGEALASGGLSLADALPSPIPSMVRPSMPPQLPGAFLFYEDFEKGMGKWSVAGNQAGLGWHLLNAATCGGLWTMVLGKAMNEPHQGQACTAYLSAKAPIDLGKAKAPQLQYDLKGVSNPPELIDLVAEVRPVGGAWKAVGAIAHGSLPLVLTFTADLSAHAGQKIELRFRGQLQPAKAPTKGFYLDDIHIVEPRK